MRNSVSIVLISILMLVPASASRAQEQKKQDQGEVKLRTELVQIDVLVTDKANKPVSGLKRDDFQLFDNNKLQTIGSFAYEESRTRRVEGADTESRALPRAIGARELKRVVAFVIDTLHIKYENVLRTRKMLSDFVDNKMQPGDLVLILPTGGGSGVLQQFTSDQRLLHRAIDRLRPFFFSTDTTPYRSFARMGGLGPRQNQGPFGRAGGGRNMPGAGGGAQTLGTNPDPLEEADARASLSALNETVKSMTKLPGRKVAVFVSEGLRTFSTETTSELNQTTALAARGNVVFYTIDPRGLEPLTLEAADELDPDADFSTAVTDALDSKRSDFYESQDSLRTLALDTGGKFFGNNNDIKRGLDDLLEMNSAYYMLGFYPEAGKWDGKYHKLKVALRDRPDLTVSFRKTYLAKSPAPEHPGVSPKVAEVIEAISSPLVRRDIDLRLTPLYIDNARREPVVTLLLHIDASKLHFDQTEGRFNGNLEEVGYVLDANGKAVDQFANTLELKLQPQTYESALKRGFVATRTMNLKPGVYQMRLFVREESSGLIGTANDFIDIPDMKADRLSISSLFLSGKAIEQDKMVDTAGVGGTPSQRRFDRTGEFSYQFVVYNAKLDDKTKQPQLEMRTRVLKGAKVVYSGPVKPLTPAEGSNPPVRIATGGVIRLISLAPDDYTLEVTVRDKLRKKESKSVVRQEIDFSVE